MGSLTLPSRYDRRNYNYYDYPLSYIWGNGTWGVEAAWPGVIPGLGVRRGNALPNLNPFPALLCEMHVIIKNKVWKRKARGQYRAFQTPHNAIATNLATDMWELRWWGAVEMKI
jgi:hypothetical protein